jgi:pimeloyl-ACP methyl ester carboxylesterase
MNVRVQRWGEGGAPILLVHGSVMNGEMTWIEQRPLARRWSLSVVDRRGYYPNPPEERENFEVDADDVAQLLGDISESSEGVHLVGHSYGGVVSLLAAARLPEAVCSLTVIEPPAFGVALDDPVVRAFDAGIRAYWEHGPREPEAFLRGFLQMVGSSTQLPSPLPPPLEQNARLLMAERIPTEAVIPLDELRGAHFPKLVVSGAHSAIFDRVCDVLERQLWAQRAVIPGAGHSVQRTGAPFNERLEAFLTAAQARQMAA